MLTRRIFLKRIFQLPILYAGGRPRLYIYATRPRIHRTLRAYGAGSYGQGVYAGHHQVYLPFMYKEGS